MRLVFCAPQIVLADSLVSLLRFGKNFWGLTSAVFYSLPRFRLRKKIFSKMPEYC